MYVFKYSFLARFMQYQIMVPFTESLVLVLNSRKSFRKCSQSPPCQRTGANIATKRAALSGMEILNRDLHE